MEELKFLSLGFSHTDEDKLLTKVSKINKALITSTIQLSVVVQWRKNDLILEFSITKLKF